MNRRLALLSSPRVVAVGMLVVGLALLAIHAGGGSAAKDGARAPDYRKMATVAPKIGKEQLRYEGKSFEQWREVLFTDLSPKTLADAVNALGAFGCKGYGPEAAAMILKRMGDYNLESYDEKEKEVVGYALYNLQKIGPAALSVLQKALQDKNENVRVFAITALSGFGDQAEAAIPALYQAMEHGNVKARVAAIGAIGSIDSSDRRFIPALFNALKDNETDVRRTAINQLSSFNFLTVRLDNISAFAGALGDRDEEIRETALENLRNVVVKFGPKAKDAVPGLIEALKGKECNELHEIVDMLANIGPSAKDAVPVLTQFMKTPPSKTRYKGVEDDRCLQGYSPEGYFQCRVYDALEKITGKKPSSPRPQPAETRSPF